MTLTADQFPEFYHAVNGFKPFPWQKELVKTVTAHDGLWPSVLDLPTSAGKTSALDAAIFLLAMQAGEPVHKRTAAIRTFFVVDRRIVVDEAAEKARNLAKQLNLVEISNPVVREVAERLKSFSGKKPDSGPDTRKPLHVSVLRGGMYRDGSWAESPTQPTICLSTVDQVGSRLLFRGYGVSPYQRAVHAGLVGNDALILVDEAHLSRPFIETLKAVEFYRSDHWTEKDHHIRTPFQVVVMSATAGQVARPIGANLEAAEKRRPPLLKLDENTDKNPDVCPELHRRLTAQKRVKLVEATEADFVSAIVRQALALCESEKGIKPVQVVGVVVNRVRTARLVAELLRSEYRKQHPLPDGEANQDSPDVVLLTGRIRPYDRDELLFRRAFRDNREAEKHVQGLLPFVKAKANKDRTDYDRPPPPRGVLFVVATQTVEVGADFSFDALVTELAPLDALRQRLGRVDRLGFRGQSRVVIIRNKEADKDDPVYGKAPAAVWKVLKEWEKAAKPRKGEKEFVIDFGIQATDNRLPKDPEERAEFLAPLCAPFTLAPVMLPAHVDDWVQTSIAPEPDPDPALFLHGPKTGPADVSVVWRDDVNQRVFDNGEARKVVALVPPSSMEAMSLPLWHIRRWLCDQNAAVKDSFTDLEGEGQPETGHQNNGGPCVPFLIWKGPELKHGTRVSRNPDDIRPGNTIVVPSSYGGCDEFGWNPDYSGDVRDVADDCSWRARRRPVLRVRPGSPLPLRTLSLWERLSVPFPTELIQRLPALLLADEGTGEIDWGQLTQEFRGLPDQFSWLRTARRVSYPDGLGAVFVGRKGVLYPGDLNGDILSEDAPADDEGNSFLGTEEYVWLPDHCGGVQTGVRRSTEALKLSGDLSELLSRAAILHDGGKADDRFQQWLYGSEAEAARNSFRLIAKSKTEGRNAVAVEAARSRAGWPKGGRHEAGSVLLARSNPDSYRGLPDAELCEYLIGSHHGRGRPLWPVGEDEGVRPQPTPIQPFALDDIAFSGELPGRPEALLTVLDSGWVELFWRVVRRYGYWGLAYLETLLVLADHRQSEVEREAQK